jgi:hypothetical protein
MMSVFREDLLRVLGGDVAALAGLKADSADEALQVTRDLRPCVSAAIVSQVLSAFDREEISASETQAWASFMQHGNVSIPRWRFTYVDIEWESAKEKEIAEALARMEELGDLIDGEISHAEAADLIAALRRPGNGPS